MAKKKTKDNERRAMVEKLRQEQQRKEKMRSYLIFGVCAVIVVGLLTAALIPYLDNRAEEQALAGKSVAKIGVTEAAAQCDPIETRKTDKNQTHVPNGPIDYPDSPPAFGAHRPAAASFERNFYTAADRPEIATLVHNLEHGFVIAWYDETLAEDKDQLRELEAIAEKYHDAQTRFIAAPWTAEDGEPFPDGKHVVLTRWSADAENPTDQSKHRGNWQYCGQTSGAVIADFVEKWPNEESPEPGIM